MNKNKINPINLLVFSFIFMLIGYFINKDLKLIKNGVEVEGEIINEKYIGGKHYIKYGFLVKGKKYFGERRTFSFTCDDGTKSCVGSKFIITYDGNDPKYSDINLEKYNKYKSGTKLYTILKKWIE